MKHNKTILYSFICIFLILFKSDTVYALDVNGIEWKLHASTAQATTDNNWSFAMGDYNHDGVQDLYSIQKNGATGTEVYILDGKSGYQSYDLHKSTTLGSTNDSWEFRLGDYNNDGTLDLYCFYKKGASSLELHVLNGKDNFQSFLLHKSIPLDITDDNFDFQLGDYTHDGVPDLFCINLNGTNSTEVHVLDGKSDYQTFSAHEETALKILPGEDWEFGVGDYNNDNTADLYYMKKNAENTTEIYILDGKNNYKSYALQSGTPMEPTDINTQLILGEGNLNIYAIKKQGSASTEIHEFGYLEVHPISGKGPLYSYEAGLIGKINSINHNKFSRDLNNIKRIYTNNKTTYQYISSKSGIPPELICAIHYRESGCNFNTYLHNGDPLGKPTVNVPKGKYFTNFTDAAIDAMLDFKYLRDQYGLTSNSNDMPAMMGFAEAYNGLGYKYKNKPSPYVYSATDIYQNGKYIADGKYSATAVDGQPGIYILINQLKNS